MLSINKIQTKMNAVPRPPRRNSRRCSASFILPMEEKVEQLLISSTEEDLHSLPVPLKPSLSSKHLSVRDLDVQRFLLEQGSAMNIPQTTPWEFLLCLALGGHGSLHVSTMKSSSFPEAKCNAWIHDTRKRWNPRHEPFERCRIGWNVVRLWNQDLHRS